MNKTRFSQNWNNKLHCKAFTTIRLASPKYRAGDIHTIELLLDGQYKQIKRAEIINIKFKLISELDNTTCLLDTGDNSQDTKRMLRRMYSKKVKDWDTQVLYLITFKTI